MATDDQTPDVPPTQAEGEAAPSGEGLVSKLGITDALKRGLSDYLQTNHIRPAAGNELNVDMEFMRNHAGPLLAHLLRSATQSILPKDMKFSVPTAPAADKPEEKPVNVSFDLGDFLSKLFNPPSTNPPR
ncbi:MAG: hypothetical protein JNJ59_16845 [Deltaproteobacteria bacterium]|jgi:hypothetical protein|nr:hypothetical protein [Deltaproteobacteria bacterium]